MRCTAKIRERGLKIRSGWSDQNIRCLRQAVTWIKGEALCSQHSQVMGFCQGRRTQFYHDGWRWRCRCCRREVRNVVW